MGHSEVKILTENGNIFLLAAATIGLFRISVDFIMESTRTVAKAVAKEKKNKKIKKILTMSQVEDLEKQSESESNSDGNDDSFEDLGNEFHSSVASMSSATHAIIFIYALIAVGLRVPMADIYGEKVQCFYSFAYSCIALLMASGLLQHYRDWERRRFGLVQRTLNLTSAGFFLAGCIIAPSGGERLYYPKDFMGSINIYLAIAFIILAFLEWFAFPFYVKKERRKKERLSRKATISMLKPYFWPNATNASACRNRTIAFLTYVCVAAAKACSLISPILIGISASAIIEEEYSKCMKYVSLYAFVQFAASFFKEAQGLLYLKVAQEAYVQLSNTTFEHLHKLSLEWHLHRNLGATIRSMDRGISACDTLMKHLFLWLIPAIVECILVCVIYATYFNFFYLAISTFYFVFVYIIVTIVLALKRKHSRRKVNKSDNEWHDICTESLVNYETVKCHAAEEYEQNSFSDAVMKYSRESVGFQTALSSLHIGQQFVFQACLATSLIIATIAIKNGEMGPGDFVAVLSYTMNLFQPLNYLAKVYSQILTAVVDLQNLSELRALVPSIRDAPNARDLPPLPPPSHGVSDMAIEFDNVVFRYPTQSEAQGLKGLSFKVKRGTKTAIVGATGAGKTTIGRLLLRFYDATEGNVRVNGVDVTTVTQKSLRGMIGCVPQFPTMFNKSLKYNIMYGRQDASDEELERVCRDAQLWDFIQNLPEGWDTIVGDRGLKLSGGEKQRTAIARCLLNQPPIVLLDEATSALDLVTESRVKGALDRMGSGRTSIVIAHRLGTIFDADNIIVLEDGVVREEGTHEELLELKGMYEKMWNLQSTKSNKPAKKVEEKKTTFLDTLG